MTRSLVLVLAVVLGSSLAHARGDGTLPLKLGNDGTLPLRLEGAAQGANGALQSQLVLTRVVNAPLGSAAGAGIACTLQSAELTKHQASGSLTVAGTPYAVRGICYDHVAGRIEFIAGSSQLVGPLAGEQPSRFTGRLTINGTLQAGRYNVSLQRAN